MHFRRESAIDMYILTGFISFASIIFVFVTYFSAKALNKFYFSHRQSKEHVDVIYNKEYYDNLANDCLTKENKECCLSSVEDMRIGNYGLLTKDECPKEYLKNSVSCADSYVWCQPLVHSDLGMDFFVGGSIFSNNINIKVADGYISYKQSTYSGNKEIENLSRPISELEIESLRNFIGSADLMGLESQNFKIIPLIPGQAYYEVSLSVDKKKNKIKCSAPLSVSGSSLECQRSMEKLKTKLNSLLKI